MGFFLSVILWIELVRLFKISLCGVCKLQDGSSLKLQSNLIRFCFAQNCKSDKHSFSINDYVNFKGGVY